MTRCEDADVRTYESVVSDFNASFIKDGEVEIGEEIFPDMDIASIITPERLVDCKVLSVAPEKIPYD